MSKDVPFIKICGVTNREDACAAIEYGATAIGFNFSRMSKRYIEPDDAGRIIPDIPNRVAVVGVFVNARKEAVEKISADLHLKYIQFHGDEDAEYLRPFATAAIKVFRVKKDFDPAILSTYATKLFLFDSHRENTFGGTGTTFPWIIASKARSYGRIIVAGGLNSDNVIEAIRIAKPYGVDVSSGVESSPGKKDHARMKQFIEQAQRGFAQLYQGTTSQHNS